MTTRLLALACLVLSACPGFGSGTLTTDERPTWEGDIQAIMQTRCVACHGEVPIANAPETFRLDVFDAAEAQGTKTGAFEQADLILQVTVSEASMPPGLPLPAEEQAKISAWVMLGAPRTEADIP